MVTRLSLYVLSLAHALHDIFTGVWLLVLAAQENWLHLSNTQVGMAAAAFTVSSAVTQPSFGAYFDRTRKPYLALLAVAWTTLSVMAAGFVPHYALLLVAACSAGLGTSAFHAAGLSGVHLLSNGRGAGSATAIFLLGGNAGFAVGAYLGGVLLGEFGAASLIGLAMPIVLTTPLLMARLHPVMRFPQKASAPVRTTRDIWRGNRQVWLPIVAFVLIAFARETVRGGYSVYLPQYYDSIGSLGSAGLFTAIFLFSAALGSFTGGVLSDRFPRRLLGAVSFVAVAPLSFLLLRTDGMMLAVLSIVLGILVNITLPIMLLIGQQILPGGASAASGYAFGITFLVRAVAEIFIGPVADRIGLQDALTLVGLIPLLTVGFFFLLPMERPASEAAQTAL